MAEATSPAPTPAVPANGTPAPAAAPATAQPTATNGPQPSTGSGASLYVGELDFSVTEAMLFEIFNMIGPVASIRVCRDAVTRRSLGYAYVNYLNQNDGERALEALNYSLIKGRPCRIMWSQRDPALRKTGQGNIFIKNLDETVDNKALHDTFAAFGDILSCKVGVDENGKSRGFAFVHYSTGESADAAIKAVNGMLLNDKKVYVGHHVSKKERQSKVEEQRAQFTNVFVKNLDPEVTDEEFDDLFKPFGEIVSAVIQKDAEGVSKGFGFVNYVDHESARKAVDELNEKEVKSQKIFVGRAQKRSERDEELRKTHEAQRMEQEAKSAGVNLYIKNIDDEWDDDRLRAEFESFGTITSCRVMKDDKGASKNFGFVCYSAPDEATKAVQDMNGKMIQGKPLYVALAQRKDVRRQALESQIAQRSQRPAFQMNQGMYGYMTGYGAPVYGQMPPMPQMRQQMYPGQMAGARPRYGQPGMPAMMPPYPAQMGGYPAMQNPAYGNVRPGGVRPPAPAGVARPTSGGMPSGLPGQLPRGSMPVRPQGVTEQGTAPAPARLNAQGLARASPADQKQMLGEALYPLIFDAQPELAGKITGMLLEMDNGELLHLIESAPALQEKVEEALRVLEEWGKEEKPAEGEGEVKEEKAE